MEVFLNMEMEQWMGWDKEFYKNWCKYEFKLLSVN